ncbi:hypothetical protein EVG20_g7656 [Dentipellis fragilis]|uniref:Protein kinase domain-containing protein n=1 Tax=Dentipellis fragilis TaxID=205917 RepID=A0A4Y9YB49_9AGAM|nr:hypothetical protein EVG20_g7656 [Dentipellis fragilis]
MRTAATTPQKKAAEREENRSWPAVSCEMCKQLSRIHPGKLRMKLEDWSSSVQAQAQAVRKKPTICTATHCSTAAAAHWGHITYHAFTMRMEDELNIVEVSRESFMAEYAPFKPAGGDVQICLDALFTAGIVSRGRDYFIDCQSKPSLSFPSEDALYGFLSVLCRVISETPVQDRTALCVLHQNLHNMASSKHPESSGSAECQFKLLESTAVSKSITAIDTISCRKAMNNAAHVMDEDVRRLSTYSITVEDEHMTLWYWSRSHSVKSSFDFTKDIFATVQVFISFIFAKMDELGYDASVQHCLDHIDPKRKPCIVFRVQDRYFKTLRTISEHLSVRITGRSTRVFEVVEVHGFDNLDPIPGQTTKVLRDVWQAADARTDRQIQDNIFEELDAFSQKLALMAEDAHRLPQFCDVSEEDKELLRQALRNQNYKRYFMTIACDQQGTQPKPFPSHALDASDASSPTSPPTSSLAPADRLQPSLAVNMLSDSPRRLGDARRKHRGFVHNRQYRVVYEEVCEALHNVENLATVIKAMEHCLLALQLLFLIGWVHRDISSGNLLWFEAGGRGILSDFEYAKKFDPDGQQSSDPKMGTSYFMAIEIQRQRYFSSYRLPSRAPHTWANIDDTFKVPAQKPRIIYNFEHDLESFFWLLLWAITARSHNDEIDALVKPIFQHNSGCSLQREEAFITENQIQEQLTDLLPNAMKKLPAFLEVLRDNLYHAYLERSEIGRLESYSGSYGMVREALHRCFLTVNASNTYLLAVYSVHHNIQSAQADPIVTRTR